jgi:hypothetical protein
MLNATVHALASTVLYDLLHESWLARSEDHAGRIPDFGGFALGNGRRR